VTGLLLTATAYPPSIGGAQLYLHSLARELAARHQVQVISQWDTNRSDWLRGTTVNAPREGLAYQVDGVCVQRLALTDDMRRALVPWVLGYYAFQGPALARIAAALEAAMAPYAGEPDLVHNVRIGREGLSLASLNLARRRGVPFVLSPLHHPRWGTWLHRHFHRMYRAANAVIALTDGERELLVRLGVDERRIFVTGMGPVLAESGDGARFRAAHGLGDNPMVLFLGQKYPYKGAAAVLAAAELVWRQWPEVRFVFVGPRTRHSRRLFAAVHDQRVLELDTVDLQTKTDALAACTVLCVPSLQESFGGVYTEAWSLGKPVIGGDIEAVRSVISDGQDGYLVAQQPGMIAERLSWLLDHPEPACAMGRRGQAKVEARYTWPRLAQLTEGVYDHVLHHVS
jgi:glycosyltransferase involved in cell wall biosynthesis